MLWPLWRFFHTLYGPLPIQSILFTALSGKSKAKPRSLTFVSVKPSSKPPLMPPLSRFSSTASIPSLPSGFIRHTIESTAPRYLATNTASSPSRRWLALTKRIFIPTGRILPNGSFLPLSSRDSRFPFSGLKPALSPAAHSLTEPPSSLMPALPEAGRKGLWRLK